MKTTGSSIIGARKCDGGSEEVVRGVGWKWNNRHLEIGRKVCDSVKCERMNECVM